MAHMLDPEQHTTFTTQDGTTYSYMRAAAAAGQPTFLLLHGFPSSAYDWRRLVPLLRAAGAGVVAPDLLGYGLSDKPRDARLYTQRRIAGHVDELLAHALGADAQVVGVGHDWGVSTLAHMYTFFPQRFTALACLTLAYVAPGPMDIESSSEASYLALGFDHFGYWFFFARDDAAGLLEQHHTRLMHILHPADPDTMVENLAGDLEAALMSDAPPPALAAYLTPAELATHAQIILAGGYTGPLNYHKQAMANHGAADYDDLSDDQLRIRVPHLWVAATRNPVAPLELMEATAAPFLHDATRVDIDASHWVMLEQPQLVFDALAAFVRDKLGATLN